jgi:GDPmannose 4,6-dehydratase|tara:strand:- start:7597 stop:8736 length:1140 start_codon:yes stop_codon:yes gene_type:complete
MEIYNISDAKKFMNDKKTVFVTGVTGQDGSHMVDYLLKNTDHTIFGGARRLSIKNHDNLKHLENNPRFQLINFDLSDAHSISKTIEQIKPDYFINLAAQTFVGSSWDFPAQTWECNTTGIIHILEAIRQHKPSCRFYNAGSSEEYGNVAYTPQDEDHPARPRSPYGASKSAARQLVKVYRESYNLYAVQGLLFNHEGTRRGEEFVTRKITKGVARIKQSLVNGKTFEAIELGNVYAKRDWSDAEDFVDGIWRMLNQEKYRVDFDSNMNLQEYVLSSNETHTIKEFVELAFKYAGIDGGWHGNGTGEEFSITPTAVDKYEAASSVLVRINPKFYRPAEVDLLLGNSNLARKELQWSPKTSFNKLVEKMVTNDLSLLGLSV